MPALPLLLSLLSCLVWLYLLLARGRFWWSVPQILPGAPEATPDIDVIVPARDEAATIGAAMQSLLAQDYAGRFTITLVDDCSTDGTADAAGSAPALRKLAGQPKPAGWSGKLWAMHQGLAAGAAPLVLFTDADIVHDRRHLSALVATLQRTNTGMVSGMVQLRCESPAERALVPAFVYFFQMLYPFAWVNAPRSRTAAAAGGTILIRRALLDRIGGLATIRGALIDDVALATAVKPVAPVYLALSTLAASIRPYPHWRDIWRMISRTAFAQLRFSALLLVVTVAGMALVWGVPVAAALFAHGAARLLGLGTCAMAAISFVPTLRHYRRSPLWALCLPLIACFYTAATVDSALDHWRGHGARWKDRLYSGQQS